jgi:hypothetical protein
MCGTMMILCPAFVPRVPKGVGSFGCVDGPAGFETQAKSWSASGKPPDRGAGGYTEVGNMGIDRVSQKP